MLPPSSPRRRSRRSGFTLLEILIVIAIIGLLAVMLIPAYLEALQKARQKRTMGEMRDTGTALMMWLTDQAGAAAAGSSDIYFKVEDYPPIAFASIRALAEPVYTQKLPQLDGWQNPYDYRVRTSDPLALTVMMIRSSGRNAAFDQTSYLLGPFRFTSYDHDLVWADGFLVSWPDNLKQ